MAKISKRMKIIAMASIFLILYFTVNNQNINVNQNALHEENNPNPAAEWPWIEIKANGEIDPNDGRIKKIDNWHYEFTKKITAEIWIERNNIVLDGKGYEHIPPWAGWSRGVQVYRENYYNLHNITIKNIFFNSWIEPIGIFDGSHHINITGNTMTLDKRTTTIPRGVWSRNARYMEIYENTINGYPEANNIKLDSSRYNKIYHNNFYCENIADNQKGYNKWYDTVNLEGNYWAHYPGEDEDGDGIGDTELPHLGVDYYPFMYPDGWVYNAPPIADAGVSYEGTEGATVTFDGSGSYDPEGKPLQYRWDFDNDEDWDTGWSSSPTADNTWNDDYSGTIVLEVNDGRYSAKDTATVTIYNVDPSVDIGPDLTVDKHEPIFFSPTIIDPGDDSFTYSWDFQSDGIPDSDLESPIHAYSDPGIYTVSLTVVDDDGGVGIDTCVITVSDIQYYVLIDDTDPTMDWEYTKSKYVWCTGAGTPEDPYIIENLIINGGGTVTCLEIRNSNSYFIIQNCFLYNSKDDNLHGGIFMQNVSNGIIRNNNCSNNGRSGMWIEDCDDITIIGNTLINNRDSGIVLRDSHLNNISLNTIDNCHNAIIEVLSTRNIISRNIINNSWVGIYLSGGSRNNVADNEIYNNDHSGINFYSSNNNITGNILLYNNRGIFAQHSNTNNVSGNTISYSINEGIYFMYCDEGIISGNNISNNKIGIWLSDHCDKNKFSGNLFQENDNYGIHIEDAFTDSDENLFFMNFFTGNGINAFDNGTGTNNQWDNGIIGNYWDDYSGVDADGDGIGDTPYIIPGTALGQDNFPIMELDTNPPTTEIILDGTIGPEGWFVTNVEVSLSATDDFAGVEVTKYRKDGGSWIIYVTPFTISKEGDTLIEFYSIDNFGNTESVKSSEFTIVKAPEVDIGADQTVNEGDLVQFDASYTDPGDISDHKISWDFGDGTSTSGILNPSHEYEENGIFTVTLTVEDGFGGIGTDSLILTVYNVAPTLSNLLATSIDEGESSTLSGTITDPGIFDTFTLTVDWGDDSSLEIFNYLAETITFNLAHQYNDDGIYTINLSIEDDDGGTSSENVTVIVSNVAPILSISGAPEVDEGSPYTLYLSATDPGQDTISEWEINWGDGNIETVLGNPPFATHTYADGPNVYPISVSVTDEDGTHSQEYLNCGFEKGNFDGWTRSIAPGGYASVVKYHYSDRWNIYNAVDGLRFARLKTGISGYYTTIERTFYLTAGMKISGWAAFDGWGTQGYNDHAKIEILNDLGIVIATPWEAEMVEDWYDGPWEQWFWTAPLDGLYTIKCKVSSDRSPFADSWALFDGEFLDFLVTVNNVEPTLTLSGLAEVDEGSLYTLSLSASDPGADTITEWEIDWGDGNSEIIPGNPPTVTHTYADGPNSFIISASATDEDGTYNTGDPYLGFESGDFTDWTVYIPGGGSADVVPFHIGDLGTPYLPIDGFYFARLKTDGFGKYTSIKKMVTLTSGQTISGWAAFDTRSPDVFNDNAMVRILDEFETEIEIPWFKDIASVGSYADDPWTEWSWTAPTDGIYFIEYRIATIGVANLFDSYALFDMEFGGVSVTVNNVAPILSLSGLPEVDEGSPYRLYLDAIDPGADTISEWKIDWRDGNVEIFPGFVRSVSHIYADGPNSFVISANATDEDGIYNFEGFNVIVNNVAPTLTLLGPLVVDEGSPYTLTLSVTDPGDDTIAEWEIDWGDGNIEPILGNPSSVIHIYKDGPNGYIISATATDEDGTYTILVGNSGFETGGFTGWDVFIPTGGSADVVTSHAGALGRQYVPMDGTYFALLKTDGPNSYTTLRLAFYLEAGENISGWAAFDARDYMPWNDNASVRVMDEFGVFIEELWYCDVSLVGFYGDSAWEQWNWTAPTSGNYTIEYRITNFGDSLADSYALFDGDFLSFSVIVNNVAPTILTVADRIVDEDVINSYLWTFTDPGVLDWHTYTIEWGDGTTNTGMVLEDIYSISVDHEYIDPGDYTVTMTLTDKDGGEDILSFEVKVSDKTPPETSFDLDGTEGNNGWYVSNVTVTLTAVDDFSNIYSICYSYGTVNMEILYVDSVSFEVSDEGTIIISYYSVDTAGNKEDTKYLTLYIDKTDPTTTHDFIGLYTELDHIYISSTETQIFLEAQDNPYGSGIAITQYQIDSTDPNGWINYENPFTVNIKGEHTIYYRSIDNAGNDESPKYVIVVVNAVELSYTGDLTGVYSDPVLLEAELLDMATQQLISGKLIVFIIGDQTVSAVTNGVASVTLILDQPGGFYTVSASFAGDDIYLSDSTSALFFIEKETAYLTYTGSTVVPTKVETFMLRVTVFDDVDGYWGDLTKIYVNFTIYSDTMSIIEKYGPYQVEIEEGVYGVGVFSIEIPLSLKENGYLVQVNFTYGENHYYQGIPSDLVPFIVYEPTGDFVTGGGWIWDPTGSKGNFGFNVKYKKNGLPKGQFIYVYREGEYENIVKATAWEGMAIIGNRSVFEAKCVIQKYNSETGELAWSEGNYRISVEVWDEDKEGGEDLFQIKVFDKIGRVYHESGYNPYGILQGGQIVIHTDEKK